MKNNHILIGTIFAFVLLMGAAVQVSAAGMDLDVYPVSTSACPCTTISEMRVFVTNLGSVADTYELSLVLPEGWPKGFIGTYQGGNSITLGPGEKSKEGDITLYITPSCTAEIGDQMAKVVARNKRTDETIEKTFMIEILKCRGVGISAPNVDMCMGVGKSYEFSILNEGKAAEVFDVSVTAAWGELTRQTVILDEGKTETIPLTLNVPTDYTGVQKMTIDVTSQTSYAKTTKEVEVNVRNCYKFDAYLTSTEKDVCLGDNAVFTLVVENNGLEADTFSISTDDDVSLEKSVVALEPGEKRSVSVSVDSDAEGTKDFAVTVTSGFDPSAIKTVTGTLNSKECKGVSIVPASESEATKKETCYGYIAQFNLLVENTGSVPATFNLTADAGELSTDKVTLEPGETKSVSLMVDTAEEMGVDETKYIVVTAETDGVIEQYNLELTANNCNAASLEITSDDEERQICVCDNVDYTVTVKNTGELRDTYELKFLNETKAFTLEPGEKKEYHYVYGTLGKEPGLKVFTAELNSPLISMKKSVELNVEPLKNCYGVDITVNGADMMNAESQVIENTKKVKVCEGVTFSLNVKNSGSKADTFTIETDGLSWVYLSSEKVILEAGEEREIYVYAAPEYETLLGAYTINVKVESEKNVSDEVGLVVNVLDKDEVVENDTGEMKETNQTANQTVTGNNNKTTNITMNMTLPAGAFSLSDVSARAMIIGLIALAIIAILVIRFFVK